MGNPSPYVALMTEAEERGDDWPPTKAGMFRGSTKRFLEVAGEYRTSLDRLSWF
jgi:hypothetical protein